MGAPLAWTMALATAGILGFAAGRYLDRPENPRPIQPVFPIVGPAGPESSDPALTAAAPRQVPATLGEIMNLRGDFTQTATLYLLAASTDRKGIERLLEEAESIGRESERRAAMSILYQRLAELDPGAAIDHMLARKDGPDSDWLYAVFYGWARADLDGALARAAKLDERSRRIAANAIVRSRDDLPTAERQALGSQLDVRIPVRDPATTDLRTPAAAQRSWQSALAIADRDARRSALFALAQEWGRQDPQAAIRAIESVRERSQRDALLQIALQGWAQKDPVQAAEWALARPPSHARVQLLATALGGLVAKDPSAAMAMLERLSATEKQRLTPNVLMNWARREPQEAAAWLAKHGDVHMHQNALAMIASIYAERDPDEAMRWAGSLPAENAQLVMGQVVERIARDDPERASAIVRQMKEGPQRTGAMAGIARTWAQSDPRAALTWLQMQSGSDVTPDLYRAIFSQWAVYDQEAAVSQSNFFLDSGTRDAAILGILEVAHLDTGLVDRLYQRLEGAQAKHQAASRLYVRLRETDPGAAERYRIAAGIAEANKFPLGN